MQTDYTMLRRLTRLCSSGYEFYCDAAERIDHPLLRQYFLQAARVKNDFITDIDRRITLPARTDSAGYHSDNWSARAWMADVTAAYNDSDHLFDYPSRDHLISRLSRAEDCLCEGFKAALTETESASLRETLLRHLIRLQETQDFLNSLQHLDLAES